MQAKKAKIERKEALELEKRKKQWNNGTLKVGLPLLMLLLLFAAFIDEIATASTGQVQSSVITEYIVNPMGVSYNEGVSIMSGMTVFFSGISALAPFYKTLADKFGRKIFLSMNVAGMGVGMFLCWFSSNVVTYIIGSVLIMFFIQHDMQIIYLYEIVPANKRATIYGIIKGLSNLSILAVPLLRVFAMKNDPALWRNIFVLPFIGAAVVAILIGIFAKESKAFLEKRIEWLSRPYEERHPAKETIKEKKMKPREGKTGLIVGLKHLFKEKQLFFILLVSCCFVMVTGCFASYVESIMYNYGMTTEDITSALMFYPVIYAMIIPLCGFVSDKIGRKKVVVSAGIIAVAGFAAFNIAAMLHMPFYIIGTFYGLYLGCWWAAIDFTNMMSSESVPTNNRGSVAGAASLVTSCASMVGIAITIIAPLLFEKIGFGYMLVTIPFVLTGVIIMARKVRETRGVDLNSIEYENS